MKAENWIDPRRVRWGILGCAGVATSVIAPAIRISHNGTLAGVASRDAAKARSFAEKFEVERSYSRYESLLNDSDIEAVYIPLPNALHAEWTIKAAARGKHVLCEKPLARNASEAREMIDACSESGVLLMEAFAYRFHPQNVLARKLVKEGKIGRVLGMTAVLSSPRPTSGDVRLSKELAGGTLMDKGCYCINVGRFILGSEPMSAFAKVDWDHETEVDERVSGLLEFPGNVRLQFETSTLLTPGSFQQGYEVFGTGGSIAVPAGFVQLETYRHNRIVNTEVRITGPSDTSERILINGEHQWKLAVEYFGQRVRNEETIAFPAEDGLSNMRALDAIYQSAAEGCVVPLSREG